MKKRISVPKTENYNQYLLDFKRYIEIIGYAKNGLIAKCNHLGEFLAWAESQGKYDIKQIRPVEIHAAHQYIRQRPHAVLGGLLSLKSVSHFMQSVRLFFTFLQQTGAIEVHPMSTLKFPPPPRKSGAERVIVTQEEIQEIYHHCQWPHERAILSLAYGCGLRNGEISKMNVSDVKLHDYIVIVTRGKGNKRRVVPMSKGVQKDLKRYYENERSQYVKRANEVAFLLNIKGDRMQGYTCRKVLKEVIVRTNNQNLIDKNIAIHNLRHSIATHLIEQGVNVEQVRNFLGHAHLETTELYTRISSEQLKPLIK